MKTKVAILGSGNIGMDLLYKVLKSEVLEIGMLIGLNSDSPRLQTASEMGIPVSSEGIDALISNPEAAEIVFDATTAKAHLVHAGILKSLGKKTIDLTPAAVGLKVVPAVNLKEGTESDNVNLISCGGQAVLGLVWAVNNVVPVEYAECVNVSASKAIGMGTRDNIDEYTTETSEALVSVAGAKKGKAIIVINPAEPPITMHNTVYMLTDSLTEEKAEQITSAVNDIVEYTKSYIPGYIMTAPPQFDFSRNLITVMAEIEGAGDYLPKYSGNLDIITQAAIKVAEGMALNKKAAEAADA